ncbi:MAG: RNA polymerase factor sigma-54 [candidate division Zixibacteria bacterium]|nr:RNA polymerase factor sigma-54 [candidate division Zixibacteria bacterium]
MKLGLGLGLGLRQKLAPQLIQSLKMLQMPILKLEQTIRHELAINPLLEEVEELEPNQEQSELETEDKDKDTEWDEYLNEDYDEGYKVKELRESPQEIFEGTTAAPINLYSHLTDQLLLLKLSEEEHQIGEYIIGNIAPDGYLSISVNEMADELDVEAEKIESILLQIHKFDPTGVGSRNLRESLLLQLDEKGMKNSLAYRIVEEHINDLGKKSILQVAKLMSVPAEKAQQSMNIIQSLSPSPAQGRFESAALPVVPDLIIERVGEKHVVFHNDSRTPQLRINNNYKQLVKRGSKSSSDTKEYIKQKMEQAKWMINSINQRRSTMIRVMESIILRQHDFFENGPAFINPLIMEDIARDVDMNVATISRVSNSKYVQTPYGVYEIKYFFTSGIAKEDGENMSKQSVKQRIQEIIKSEPVEKPFSDQEIFRRLNEEGIKLARRTVTKYREEMKIQPARLRKRVT